MCLFNHGSKNDATIVKQESETMLEMSTLAERIAEASHASGHSITEISKACGVSYQAVRKWMLGESKKIDGENLIALCKLTNYSPEWIITGKGEKIRYYAKSSIQAETLAIMQTMQPDVEYKIREIAELLSKKT